MDANQARGLMAEALAKDEIERKAKEKEAQLKRQELEAEEVRLAQIKAEKTLKGWLEAVREAAGQGRNRACVETDYSLPCHTDPKQARGWEVGHFWLLDQVKAKGFGYTTKKVAYTYPENPDGSGREVEASRIEVYLSW